MPGDLEFGNHIVICASTDELIIGCLGAVVRSCQQCQTDIWYNPEGDEFYGQGLAQFECIDCAAEHYSEEDVPLPCITETTRKHLRSLGLSNQRIEDLLFLMVVDLIGRKRRRRS